MACGGCASARTAGVSALVALGKGDREGFDKALAQLERTAETEFAGKAAKQTATRMVAQGLSRLAARR